MLHFLDAEKSSNIHNEYLNLHCSHLKINWQACYEREILEPINCELWKFAVMFDLCAPESDGGKINDWSSKNQYKQNTSSEDYLALNLAWTNIQRPLMALKLIFGMTVANETIYLKCKKRIFVDINQKDNIAITSISNRTELMNTKKQLHQCYPISLMCGQQWIDLSWIFNCWW